MNFKIVMIALCFYMYPAEMRNMRTYAVVASIYRPIDQNQLQEHIRSENFQQEHVDNPPGAINDRQFPRLERNFEEQQSADEE